jgi:hypothetical protein
MLQQTKDSELSLSKKRVCAMCTSCVLTQNLEGKRVFHGLLLLLLHDWVGSFARQNLSVLVSGRSEEEEAPRFVCSVLLK